MIQRCQFTSAVFEGVLPTAAALPEEGLCELDCQVEGKRYIGVGVAFVGSDAFGGDSDRTVLLYFEIFLQTEDGGDGKKKNDNFL